jgi:hypothetical protein
LRSKHTINFEAMRKALFEQKVDNGVYQFMAILMKIILSELRPVTRFAR